MAAAKQGQNALSMFLSSTIGRKQIVGVAGLGMAFFLLTHMAGNMLMFVSPEAYNNYGHALVSNPAIYIAEAGLIAIFLGHIIVSLTLTVRNKEARENKYHYTAKGEKKTSFVQKTMIHQGIIILAFVVLHLVTFKFGTYYIAVHDGEVRDLYRLIVEKFSMPYYSAFYILTLIIIGYHLSHGVQSSIQTLGFNHPRYTPMIKTVSIIFALIVSLGFISQPVAVLTGILK